MSEQVIEIPQWRWEAFVAPFLAQRERLFLWAPVLFALGIGIYFSLPFEPFFHLTLFFTGLSVACILLYPRTLFFIPVMLVVFGFAAANIKAHLVAAPVLSKKQGPAMIEGRVSAIESLPTGYRMVVDALAIENLEKTNTPKKFRLTVRGQGDAPTPGSRVKTLAIINPPSAPVMPGAFDFQRHAYFQQIGGYGFVLKPVEIISENKQGAWLESIRQVIVQKIQRVIETKDSAGVAAALVTGKRKGVSEETLEDIRKAGIAHLLAISGLHVGLIAGFVFFVLRAILAAYEPVALRYPIKKISAAAAMLAAIGYMVLVGAPVPTQRAVLMTGIVMVAVLFDRQAISLRLAAIAALIVLLFSPESLLGPSFQMSFAAVVVLIAAYDSGRPLWQQAYRQRGFFGHLLLYFVGVVITTVLATLATAPFAIFHFGRVAVLPSLLANMLAVPMMAFVIMPAGLVSVFLMPFGVEALTLRVMEWGIDQILQVAEWTAALEYSVVYLPSWPVSALVLIVLGGLWMVIWCKRLRLAGAPLILLGLVLAMTYPMPDILISHDARLLGIKTESGELVLSSTRREKFVGENWGRLMGDADPGFWDIPCDDYGCVWKHGNKTIAFVTDPLALAQDCRIADIVISTVPARKPCRAAHVIDRFDVWRKGSAAVYLDRSRIVYDRDIRGNRPWVNNAG